MSTFTVQLQQFADKTKAKADNLVGLVVVKLAAVIDFRSPIGDATFWKHPPPKGYVGGRFRGNWMLGVNSVPSGETGRLDRSAKDIDRGGDTTATIQAALPPDGEIAGNVYFITNNSPYGQRIEDGWSRQAPSGLVALTAMEFQTKVNEAAAEAKQ